MILSINVNLLLQKEVRVKKTFWKELSNKPIERLKKFKEKPEWKSFRKKAWLGMVISKNGVN